MSHIQNMVKEEKVEKKEEVKESPEKAARRAYFDNYAKKNPVKYAQKKEAFEKELSLMK